MKTNRLILPLVAALAASILNGCGTVGPNSIKFGRNDYNEVLHGTSGNQLLLNLVRIHNHEPPLFIEVTEIDAAVQIQTNVTGTISQIGAHPGSAGGTLSGQLASVGGNATYTEAPIIRYQPLQGAPLIAQLNKPISVDSLVYMFDSDWPLDTFLPLVIDRIAPGGSENYSTVMRAILALNNNNALIIEATQSGQTEGAATGQSSKKSTAIAPQPNAGKQENNALTLYFDPKGLSNGNFKCQSDLEDSGLNIIRVSVGRWLYLLKIYRPKDIPADVNVTDAHIVSASLAELQRIFSKLPTTIEIPTKSFSGQNHERKAPLLHTRSALGVMKRLAEDQHSLTSLAKFVSHDEATHIMSTQPNKPGCKSPGYNYAVPGENVSGDLDTSVPPRGTTDFMRDPNAYGVWMLIQQSDSPPATAYVSAFENGTYYFITDDDEISKRTLTLLALITSIQAIPNEGGGLQASLSVGAK